MVVNTVVVGCARPDDWNCSNALFTFTTHPKTRHMQLRVIISNWNTVIQNQDQKWRIIQHYDNCHNCNFDVFFSELHFKVFWDVVSCSLWVSKKNLHVPKRLHTFFSLLSVTYSHMQDNMKTGLLRNLAKEAARNSDICYSKIPESEI